MTILVVIFAEVLPKTYAIRHAERVALAVAPFMKGVVLIAWPITHGLQAIVLFMFKILGDRGDDDLTDSDEEIRGTLALYKHEGGLVKDEHAMLDGVLDLSQVEVSEVMTHRRTMETINADDDIQDIIEAVLTSPFTRIPLYREDPDNVVGVLHAKNLLRELYRREGSSEGLDIMEIATEPWFVPDTTTLSEQLSAFRERHAHFALVVDEYSTLMGLVTLEDILEEIVGEIEDEHDVAVADTAVAEDGSITVEGAATIRDINREFDWHLPDEEATTIAGLVIHEAQLIPEVGQIFVFHGFRFEVTARVRNQLTQLRVTPIGRRRRTRGLIGQHLGTRPCPSPRPDADRHCHSGRRGLGAMGQSGRSRPHDADHPERRHAHAWCSPPSRPCPCRPWSWASWPWHPCF